MSRPPNRRPWWLGIAVVAIGSLWLYQASTLQQVGGYAALGPGFFVTIVGLALVVLGLILLVQIARGETFEPQATESAEASVKGSAPALLWAAAGVLVPLVSMRSLGFPLTAMLAFALVTRAFGSRRLVFDCLLGLVLGTVCWFGFTRLGVSLGGILPLAGV